MPMYELPDSARHVLTDGTEASLYSKACRRNGFDDQFVDL
ncbi:hypothetical protein Poly59_56340 [Rubripirellula reticaptiva]|uniref:Uncharacterized protein n=1 Tax=Rubripirellula reticaptiva TaxID=2528013 RepID=A0A5C6EG28_9BACT|nr:hypothetical protein Poly59_56340 [Rubripirellula reticaptiva]